MCVYLSARSLLVSVEGEEGGSFPVLCRLVALFSACNINASCGSILYICTSSMLTPHCVKSVSSCCCSNYCSWRQQAVAMICFISSGSCYTTVKYNSIWHTCVLLICNMGYHMFLSATLQLDVSNCGCTQLLSHFLVKQHFQRLQDVLTVETEMFPYQAYVQ